MNSQDQSGVSLIEILLVIALIAVIGVSTTPFLSNFIVRNSHELTIDEILSSIRKAQGNSMQEKNGNNWGVCLQGNNLRMFRASCQNASQSENFTISNNINISGLNEITFNKAGEPSNSLNINVDSDLETQTITLNAVGGIEID